MKIIELVLGIMLFCSCTNAQTPAFEYQNLSDQMQIASFSFQDANDEYIIATDASQDSKIIKLDNHGNLLNTRMLKRDGYEVRIWHIFEKNDNYIALGIQSYLELDSTLLWILEMDKELNILNENHHFIAHHFTGLPFQCNTQYSDTLICTGSGVVDGIPLDQYGFKYISIDEVIMSPMDWGFFEITNDIIVFPDNPDRYLINGFDLYITDAAFNIIDAFSTFHYGQVGDMHLLSDSTFLLAGKDLFSGGPGGPNQIRIGIFDYTISEINSVLIGSAVSDSVSYTTFSKSIDTFGDNIYLGGTSRVIEEFPITLQEGNSNFILGKYDHDLDEQWVKLYGGDAYYFMTHMHATNDGGCLMIGTKHDYINTPGVNQLYVLKVDSDGEITNTTTIPLQTNTFSIYPNPATDYMVLEFEENIILPENAIFEIYDLLGRKMLEQKINNEITNIDVRSFGAATYVVVVKDGDGRVIGEERVVKVE